MALLILALRALAGAAFARAGGGHSFHSGGSFHSSGGFSGGSSHSSGFGSSYDSGYRYSSGSSGGDDVIFNLIQSWLALTFSHPVAMLPLNLAIAWVAYRVWFVGKDFRVQRTIAEGLEAQDDVDLARNAAALKERDPGFDLPAFLKRAESTFLVIQAAWSGMDMSPARAVVSDGVMERFTLQLGMLKGLGLRNDMKDVQVLSTRALQFESGAFWDAIHVAIEASAVDRDVSLKDGSVVRGSDEPDTFCEVWTFVRRPGAKTLAGRGALEGQCPNCGTPLKLIDGEQCAACKSWLNSGEFDWVLCEITQQSEWSAREPGRDVPGFIQLAAADPALNTRFLEDRASVAFWRWQEALWSGSVGALLPVATDSFCATVKPEAESSTFYKDAAIGAVITLACEPGAPMDRAHVVVRWSGVRCDKEPDGIRELGDAYQETVFTLERRAGVATDAKAGLRSLRCASCGAPPTSREAFKCEYCGRAFNDGSRQWVLAGAVPASEWRMPQGLSRQKDTVAPAPAVEAAALEAASVEAASAPPAPSVAAAAPAAPDDGYAWTAGVSPNAALRVMISAMMADGVIDTEEQRYLVQFARARGIQPSLVGELVQAAQEGRLELPVPQSSGEAAAFLRGVVIMSLADGRVQPAERRAIDACAVSLGLTKAEVDELIERERGGLYERAKAALAARRENPA